ncbi:transcription termination factor NusA [Candidatus Falkowbacteria bacterium CG1_02_37_44]|uniref:Transcription termination/antitermination protein NusA n=1 Tax=Candidatus Falkowbacteria bacterium CG1_02_37_44 TaxID=1805146 RepID=A0A1J4T6X4_9BACT|nr:MAG: transcription termination factor NusA [Candidatus Falkowbacteria bacterium CG1_02_37_44]PIX11104.1 MAG: transcription termination/antitermination protein NusA [Candidatus Falkowbacteria bacterium CG_4_8_14_3_um_filter_36_11]
MSELKSAIKQICDEKGLSYEAVIATIESALAAAYRKDYGDKNQNVKVEFDPETSQSKVFDVKTVVDDMPEEPSDTEALAGKEEEKNQEIKKIIKQESKEKKQESPLISSGQGKEEEKQESKKDVKEEKKVETEEEKRRFNLRTEIQISAAKMIKKKVKIGDEIKTKLPIPESYGRMAAQTAKQVIIQRLREAERAMILDEFEKKQGEVISGVVQRREGRMVLIDLGKSAGILNSEGQIYNERYNPGDRIKVYVKEVKSGPKGPEIILSRTSDEILKKVFYLEIPEISNGLIELKGVARKAGSRSKVAVAAVSDHIDPIGSCVGQRGARIQTIIRELGGEKVDIIEYNEDPDKFITNSLSPAKIIEVKIKAKEKKAIVIVAADQLSLAIGKGGQNVRLAARLTGYKIDIAEKKEKPENKEEKKQENKDDKDDKKENKKADKDNKKGGKKDKKKKEKDGKKKEEIADKKEN